MIYGNLSIFVLTTGGDSSRRLLDFGGDSRECDFEERETRLE